MLLLKFFFQLVPCLALGFLIGHFKPGLSSKIARPLIRFGIPIGLMGLILNTGINLLLIESVAMALFAIGLLLILIRTIPKFRFIFKQKTLLLGSLFGNSGYFGIPVSLAILPPKALSFSIGYDLGATLLIWSLGPILMSRSSEGLELKYKWKSLGISFVKSPASQGLLGAFGVLFLPWSDQITSALWLPSRLVFFLALMIVGMRLSSLKLFTDSLGDFRYFIKPTLLTKLFVLPSIMLGLSLCFNLPSLMRDALVLQAACPTAISVLLLAEANKNDQELASSLVAWSTLLAIISVPIWSIIMSF